MSNTMTRPPTGWVGWVAFAGIMMLINGVMNIVSGIAAIAEDEIYVEGDSALFVLDLTTFGWIHLGLGVLVTAAGFFVLRGAVWAIAVAVVVSSINVLTQMVQLPAYPFWSLLIIGVNVLVLWALVVHGKEMTGIE